MQFWLIGIGGVFGAIARYLCGKLVDRLWPVAFPLGTLLINVVGSFLLGLVVALNGKGLVGDLFRMSVGVGFLGAFTTFSTFGYETMILTEDGQNFKAMFYAVASIVLGIALAWVAIVLI